MYGCGGLRLKRQDWIAHGLETLAAKGGHALKVLPMTEALGVSRGSFYWHFENLEAFHAAVLAAWAEQSEGLGARLAEAKDPLAGLEHLVRIASEDDLCLERAVRAWAASEAWVDEQVAAVDRRRLSVLAGLFCALGLTKRTAHVRAAFLYAASLGQLAVARSLLDLRAYELRALVRMLGQP